MTRILLIIFLGLLSFNSISQDISKNIAGLSEGAEEKFVRGEWTEDFIQSDGLSLTHRIQNFKIENASLKYELVDTVFSFFRKVDLQNDSDIPGKLEFSYSIFKSAQQAYLEVEFIPFFKRGENIFKLESYTLKPIENNLNNLKSTQVTHVWAEQSVLANGSWVKIKASEKGIHKISYSELQDWGFSSPENVSVFGIGAYMLPKENSETFYDDLKQIPVWIGKDATNSDCIFFYSTGNVKWEYNETEQMFLHQKNPYSEDAFYYLTDGVSTQLIDEISEETTNANVQITSFDEYEFHESDEANMINSGATWYGDKHNRNNAKAYEFSFTDRDKTGELKTFCKAIGRSSESSMLRFYINNDLLGNLSFSAVSTVDVESTYARTVTFADKSIISDEDIQIKTTYVANTSDAEAWIDFIDVNYKRQLNLSGGQLLFRDIENVSDSSVGEFLLANGNTNVQIWNVTNFVFPVKIPNQYNSGQNTFKAKLDELKEFVAFNPLGDIYSVEKDEEIENQNLHGAESTELLIITHPDFITGATELAEFHIEHDNLSTSVYTTEQVYNEFSGGIPDPAGIRNFVRMCYEKSAGSGIKYVLLIGDGSFDNRDIRGKGFNFVPTYQSIESLIPVNSFVSDDFYVLLDENEGAYTGLIDLGIGRLPVRTAEELNDVITKIKKYVEVDAIGNWRNIACFIGDDGNTADGFTNQHVLQCESLTTQIAENYPSFYTDKIYFDAYRKESSAGSGTYPDVEDAINERVKDGVLILNYIGHANEEFLADERVLDINMIDSWTNINNLPVFVTATCEFSRFDEDELSAGEHILFNPNGGGVGLFSTTRLVYSGANFNLSKSFYSHVFEKDENGENLRMGDIMRLAKVGSNTGINKRNFSLLADPALKLSYPQLSVQTLTINGQAVDGFSDNISALEKVTITGNVIDNSGAIQSDFNGEVIPIVYDKEVEYETLGNVGQNTINFGMQSNVIYKGNVSVTNGEFSFSFIVPKDISYSVGSGKIMYYADNGIIDANGAFSNFNIGGSSGSVINDTSGPEINLYMNDDDFQSGDKVGASPLMIAEVYDENGINTVGTGIGHDITAILDGDNSNVYVLNDYYQSDKDSYTSGKVVYPFNNLEPGKHTLTLKIWDVVNNSSESTIEFVVTSDFEIDEIYCYPNPVSDFTNLVFTHNLPDELFTAVIEIFDIRGSLIDSFTETISSSGTESVPLKWYASDAAQPLKNGMYFFRINLTSSKGFVSSKTGKFIFKK